MQDLKSRLNILHCPTTVGGNPQGLAGAERRLGYNSKSLTLVQNYFNYPADYVVFDKSSYSILNEIRMWRAAFGSLRSYNVLHYNFGQSISPLRAYPNTGTYPKWKVFLYSDIYSKYLELFDVRCAHYMGKVVAVTYQGDDVRQQDYCQQHYSIHPGIGVGRGYYSDSSDRFKRTRARIFDRYADIIYALNPDIMNVLPARTKFVPYASVDPREWTRIGVREIDPDIPHVVHAPSNRGFKGTAFIEAAIKRLQEEGVRFRYTFVEGRSHEEARKIYETADILIDQVLAGFYGALAVELMALGKPVICYLREEDMHFLPPGMRDDMPIINARPDNIYDVLKEMLTDRKHELQSIGVRSRAYVEKWHDPIKIAAEITQDYQRVYAEKHCGKRAD